MKVSIIREDNSVVVDGIGVNVDCSALPSYVHAVQWDGGSGHVEFKPDDRGLRHSNMKIVDLAPYQFLVDAWQTRRAELVAQAAAEAKRRADEQARIDAEKAAWNERRAKLEKP